jgi:hypothetical protein
MRDLTILLLALAVAGCTRADDDAREGPGGVASAGTAPAGPSADTGRARYRCADGHRVEVVDDTARVTLRNGTVVDLPRSAQATGTLYAGQALEFTVIGEAAQLARDEGAHWACMVE